MKHIKLFEEFGNPQETSPKVAIYIGDDGSDVLVLDKAEAEKLIGILSDSEYLTVDYKELAGNEKYVIWNPNKSGAGEFEYRESPDEDGYVVYPNGETNYATSSGASENWSIPLLYNRAVSIDGGQGNRVEIIDNPIPYLIDKYAEN